MYLSTRQKHQYNIQLLLPVDLPSARPYTHFHGMRNVLYIMETWRLLLQ